MVKAKDPFKDYKRWRKKAAKNLDCSEEGIDAAIEEGHQILTKMCESNNPLYELYGRMPMCAACLSAYLYAQNPLLRRLMESPFNQTVA